MPRSARSGHCFRDQPARPWCRPPAGHHPSPDDRAEQADPGRPRQNGDSSSAPLVRAGIRPTRCTARMCLIDSSGGWREITLSLANTSPPRLCPLPACRCLFEIAQTSRRIDRTRLKFLTSGFELAEVASIFSRIDVASASCFDDGDKKLIQGIIRSEGLRKPRSPH